MTKNIFLSFLFLTISFSAFSQKSYTINGKVSDKIHNGKKIYLKEFDRDFTETILDSTVINNQAFTFKGNDSDTPKMGFLLFGSSSQTKQGGMLILEPGDINIEIGNSSQVGGTPMNNDFQQFFDTQAAIVSQIYQLKDPTGASSGEYDKLVARLSTSMYDYIRKNIKTKVGEFLLIDGSKALSKTQLKTIMDEADPAFVDSPLGRRMTQVIKVNEPPAVGDQYRDLKLRTKENRVMAISDYVGKNKLVLIDFWASWCGPCIKEMPTLIEAYRKYKDKGFEIVGISLDDDRDAWETGMRNHKTTWPQMSDAKGWKSEATQVYGITSIPFILLVDEKGTIVAKNIRGQELLDKLEELLK